LSQPDTYRLPRSVLPERYRLELAPYLDTGRFDGTVDITVRVVEPVEDFRLHAAELDVHDATLALGDHMRAAGAITLDAEREQVVLSWPEPVTPGRHLLRLRFSGTLNDRLRGFYRSTYVGDDGTRRLLAATQCEPDFKAVFSVALTVDNGLAAFSNGPVVAEESAGPGRRRVVFGDTIPMSTYLLALAVGPFEATPPHDVDGVPLRIVAPAGRLHLTGLAEEAAAHALHFFRRYFDIPYPGEKLDHIAVPDFAFGAMENLGLVTYRQDALLVDVNRAGQRERQGVVGVIGHETAHMWFGDLVTMRWWNGVWLNEAFATFMQTLQTDDFEPAWEVWTQFAAQRAAALSVDSLASTRPIDFPVGPPAEALQMLDVLTYVKGAGVLRMLEQYLGPDVFRRGISTYLTRHRYGNTDMADLWAALEDVSGQPVGAVMHSWLARGGHPSVAVHLDAEGHSGSLHQHRFRFDMPPADDGAPQAEPEPWKIPVTLRVCRTDGTRETRTLLMDGADLRVDWGPSLDYVVVNAGASGFYRVRYDDTLWSRLRRHWNELTPPERVTLMADTWAAVLAGEESLPRFADLVRTLVAERHPDVWAAAAAPLAMLDLVAGASEHEAVQALVAETTRPLARGLGLRPTPGEAPATGRLRAQVVRLLGVLADDPTLGREALARLRAHVSGTDPLDPDLLPAMVDVAAYRADADTWEFLYRQYQTARTPQDELRFLAALGGVTDPQLVDRSLALYLSPEVRTQDAPWLLARMLANRFAQAATWSALEAGWDVLLAKYPANAAASLLHPIRSIVDEDLAARINRWLDAHPVPQAARPLAQAREMQAVHQAFARRVRGRLAQLLQA
jgi:puromycin-sensitive aminopeptidase